MGFFNRSSKGKSNTPQPSSSVKRPVPAAQTRKPAQVPPKVSPTGHASSTNRPPPPEASRKPPLNNNGGVTSSATNNSTARKSANGTTSAFVSIPASSSLQPSPPKLSVPKAPESISPPTAKASSIQSTSPPATSPTSTSPSSQQLPGGPENYNLANIELTRGLVKKFIADIWNRGELDLIPEVCSPSLRFNGNNGFDRVGHEGLARMVATIREALEDYHCEIHSMVVEHNKAFCRLRFTGKHTGFLLGYPPTGKVVGWMGATEFTCQNGKILKVWELGDIKTLEEQLISSDQHTEASEMDDGHQN